MSTPSAQRGHLCRELGNSEKGSHVDTGERALQVEGPAKANAQRVESGGHVQGDWQPGWENVFLNGYPVVMIPGQCIDQGGHALQVIHLNW